MTIILWHQELCGIIIRIKTDDENENSDNSRINNSKAITRKSLEYKIKIIIRTSNDNKTLDAEVVVLLKYLHNFWRSLDLPLINCEIELDV